jgi:hypothetical protein
MDRSLIRLRNGGITSAAERRSERRSFGVRKHGDNAELGAARLQDLMLDRGDDEGRLVWARIRRAIAYDQPDPRLGDDPSPRRRGDFRP